MIDDLKELLVVRHDIERIKTEAQDPLLDADAKLTRLRDLQAALERLKALKEVLEAPASSKLSKRSHDDRDDLIDSCRLELVETVPDVLIEKGLSRPLTSKAIFQVIDCDPIPFSLSHDFGWLGLVESI